MQLISQFRAAAAVLTLLLCSTASLAAPQYSFTVLNAFGGSFGNGMAVNASGTAVGYAAQPPDGGDPPLEPVRPAKWNSPTAVDLGVVDDGAYGYAMGINDAGQVVGRSFLPVGGVRATLWANGSVTDLGTLGGDNSEAYAINNAGVIVGATSVSSASGQVAFAWRNGTMQALPDLGGEYHKATAIASNGLIAGSSRDSSDKGYAVLWRNGTLTVLGQGTASGVNKAGVVVGSATSRTGYVHGALWNGTSVKDLGTLGGSQSMATGINDAGYVVGTSSVDGCCSYHATLWFKGKIYDLNSLVDASVTQAGWVLTQANAISRKGLIVGNARNDLLGVSRAFVLTPVASR